jgi:HD-GYP domain-containing protein (c-di-GMP phosphodiesterase class II)
MKKIKTSDLKEGMMFSKPVYISGDNLLVPPLVNLKQKDIERLIKWNIAEVETEGDSVTEEEKELIALHNRNESEALQKKEGYELYLTFIQRVEEIFKNLKNKNEEKASQYLPIVSKLAKDIAHEVVNNQSKLLEYVARGSYRENRLSTSAVNCSILAAVIGQQLKFSHSRLMELVTGAILHDAGMLRINELILNKKEKLKDEELRLIMTHTPISYVIISKEMKLPEDVAAIGIYHHERWDGTGYPKKLKGEEIPLFARIVSVADAYEAMVNKRPYRKPLIGYSAIKNILNDNGTHFDPNILGTFLKCIGIYPIGSFVLLNSNIICKVIDLNATSPMRPQVELLLDSSGKKLKKREKIDLSSNDQFFILKAIDPEAFKDLINE